MGGVQHIFSAVLGETSQPQAAIQSVWFWMAKSSYLSLREIETKFECP